MRHFGPPKVVLSDVGFVTILPVYEDKVSKERKNRNATDYRARVIGHVLGLLSGRKNAIDAA